MDWHRWHYFIDRPSLKQLAKNADFKLIRVFDFRPAAGGLPRLMPCLDWAAQTWDWTHVDALTQAIFDVGAEPLYCLGWFRENTQNYIPPNMPINPNTGLPHPDDYAAYAREWVKHFKAKGWPVRFYHIGNEPAEYYGWSPSAKLGYYVDLWNACARAMRSENPNVLLSHGGITQKMVFDYCLTHGDDVDFLDTHKYDAGTVGQRSDAEMFSRAETYKLVSDSQNWYGLVNARQKFFDARGKWLPIINSETNFNSAWQGGTDPKIQQIAGAVWLALMLRTEILNAVNYNVYFEYSSSKSWQENQGTGWGFGMINEDDNKPWYPYYVNLLIGKNLAVNDKIVEANSTSEDIRVIAWNHYGQLNILLICKTTSPQSINLQGVTGQLQATWIDNTFPYTSPQIQTAILNAENPVTLNGYTVMLLQQAMPISLVKIAAALTVTLIIIGGAYYFVTRRG